MGDRCPKSSVHVCECVYDIKAGCFVKTALRFQSPMGRSSSNCSKFPEIVIVSSNSTERTINMRSQFLFLKNTVFAASDIAAVAAVHRFTTDLLLQQYHRYVKEGPATSATMSQIYRNCSESNFLLSSKNQAHFRLYLINCYRFRQSFFSIAINNLQ